MAYCKSIACMKNAQKGHDYCTSCLRSHPAELKAPKVDSLNRPLSEIYPKYYKPVGELTEVDVYAVHHLFQIQDCSGAIQHASKKLLLSGVRTGGKTAYQDIKEARDTLNRYLQLNAPPVH